MVSNRALLLAFTVATQLFLASCQMMQTSVMGYKEGKVSITSMDPDRPAVTYEVISSDSDGPTAEGINYVNLDEFEQAKASFERAVAEDASDANALFLAGLANEVLGDYAKAKDYYEKAYLLDDKKPYSESYRRVKNLP